MLNVKVYVFNPQVSGPNFTVELYFQDPSKPQFVNLGDRIQLPNSNKYDIISATLPLVDGATITVSPVNGAPIPVEDVDFDSILFTPGQPNYTPDVRTAGAIGTVALYSGPNYEYTILTGWTNPAEASKAALDDRIVDSAGREFDLTYIDPVDRFDVECRVIEVNRLGIAPVVGEATLYRPTPSNSLFQGTEITDPARTVIQNREFRRLDDALSALSSLSSTSLESSFLNNSGGTLNALTPVKQTLTGSIALIDPSVEADAKNIVGLLKEQTLNAAMGIVVTEGILQNVTTSFSVGDVLYVSKIGGLTATPPETGVGGFVSGDFVIKVGQITKNADNPLNKDFLVSIQLIGQL